VNLYYFLGKVDNIIINYTFFIAINPQMNDYTKNSVDSDRILAQVVTVDSLSPITGADKIELARILGWQCVVKKGDFAPLDLAIYFSIDSVLDPENKNTSFLEGKRLKTKMILKTLSQGLLGPIQWATDYGADITNLKAGDDLTKTMKVKKFVPNTETDLYSNDHQPFPSSVPKTDEERIQNMPHILTDLIEKRIVCTRKEDGTSTTYVYHDNKFSICGRNHTLQSIKDGPHYFAMATKFDIEAQMKKLGRNLAIQGEIVGPKINGNKLKLKDLDFRVFNIWDIDAQCYLPWDALTEITRTLNLPTVPVIFQGPFPKEWATVDALLKVASELEYDKNVPAEGIVIKTDSKELPRHSFKVISNSYLIKHG
jgi:RNA ligase (TIGR02306 family)